MKRLILIFAAVFVGVFLLAGIASADRAANPYRERYRGYGGATYYALRDGRTWCIDTLNGLTPDTVTVRKLGDSRGFNVFLYPDTISAAKTPATDSLAAYYRPIGIDSKTSVASGSALVPLLIRKGTGDSAYVVDWTPGAQYWVEDFTPEYAPVQQFIFYGSAGDTIPVTIVIEPIVIER